MLNVFIYTTAKLLLIAQLKHTESILKKKTNPKHKQPQEIDVSIICLFSFSVSEGDKIIASIF